MKHHIRCECMLQLWKCFFGWPRMLTTHLASSRRPEAPNTGPSINRLAQDRIASCLRLSRISNDKSMLLVLFRFIHIVGTSRTSDLVRYTKLQSVLASSNVNLRSKLTSDKCKSLRNQTRLGMSLHP